VRRILLEIDCDTGRAVPAELVHNYLANDEAARASTSRQREHIVISSRLAVQACVRSRCSTLVKIHRTRQQELSAPSPIGVRTRPRGAILEEQYSALLADWVISAEGIAIRSSTRT
jgi:hypothetical protein